MIQENEMFTATNSELTTLKRCERLHYYRYIMLRRPPRDALALIDGGDCHHWLEDFWNAAPERRAPGSPMIRAMVAGYEARYPHNGWQAPNVVKVLGIEKQLIFTVTENIRIALKLDGLIEINGKIFVLEHKTSGMAVDAGADYWRALRLDTQISTYVLACRVNGIDVAGVIYDVLKKPSQRPLKATPEADRKYTKGKPAKPASKGKPAVEAEPSRLYAGQRETDETEEEYFQRLCLAIAEDPERFYIRETIIRTDEELQESALELVTWAKRAVENGKAARAFLPVKNTTGCQKWGRLCEYFNVCSGATSIESIPVCDRKHEELELED